MTKLSDEQLAIIGAPLSPMSVIACAGSGKTLTAVRRLAHMRRQLGYHRGRVALLSFSNVAVNTFRQNYHLHTQDRSIRFARDRVEIDTLDGFITSHVLRPHAYRTMAAKQAAFLVMGSEPFLSSFTLQTATYPRGIGELQVGIRNGAAYFYYVNNDKREELNIPYATGIVQRLGRTGAYTHNLGRYWCYRTLQDQPAVLRALARRYPYILIDEAQDIGAGHQAIIEQLIDAGSLVSLIGDPHQGIYEFAGADGTFLSQYKQRANVGSYSLTLNYRSVPAILDLANKVSSRNDGADRDTPDATHGPFFIPYKQADRHKVIAAFQEAVLSAGLKIERSAVLCRSREQANKLAGNEGAPGQGTVKALAQAAILRDKHHDYLGAFKSVAACIIGLLKHPPRGLLTMVTQPTHNPEFRPLRQLIWRFTRDAASGLPAATLTADAEWHPELVKRTKALLKVIEQHHGMSSTDNLGKKLARKGLPNSALMIARDLADERDTSIRVDTVHQVKGESLDAVLYLANKEHVTALLGGVTSEVGRIGYVALTRARNLLWLGVPANAVAELRATLLDYGFQEVGTTVTHETNDQDHSCAA